MLQLGLVRNQLQTFEDWGGVRCWTIALRKAEQDALAKEKQNPVAHTNHVSVCWERFLLPYLGVNKTFTHVRQVLEVIAGKFNEADQVLEVIRVRVTWLSMLSTLDPHQPVLPGNYIYMK